MHLRQCSQTEQQTAVQQQVLPSIAPHALASWVDCLLADLRIVLTPNAISKSNPIHAAQSHEMNAGRQASKGLVLTNTSAKARHCQVDQQIDALLMKMVVNSCHGEGGSHAIYCLHAVCGMDHVICKLT